jgi:hypothetical protein
MSNIGNVKYGFQDNYTITVRANETTVSIETNKNHIVLDYNERTRFLSIIDAHIKLYDKANEVKIDYVRNTGQMISKNIKIMFSFYYDKDTEKSAMRMNVSYMSGANIEIIDLDKERLLELKRIIEESVTDRDKLASNIKELNSIVNEINGL